MTQEKNVRHRIQELRGIPRSGYATFPLHYHPLVFDLHCKSRSFHSQTALIISNELK